MLQKLLSHLPERGCRYCVEADPPVRVGVQKECCCEDVFLFSLPSLDWRPNMRCWYGRQRRGEQWHRTLVARVSVVAGLHQKYTNSSFRPTGITEMGDAGYTNNEIAAEFSGHKCLNMVEHYRKNNQRLKVNEKKDASMLVTPSGRMFVRTNGANNLFGKVGESSSNGSLGRRHRELVQQSKV